MSWISVLLLAAGAIAAGVPSSGSYNQVQRIPYDVTGDESYEDSGIFGNIADGRQSWSEVPSLSKRYVGQNSNMNNQYQGGQNLNSNVGLDYTNDQQSSKPGLVWNDSVMHQRVNPSGDHNRRNGHPAVGVYGQGGYESESHNVPQKNGREEFPFAATYQQITPVDYKVGTIDTDFGLSELDDAILQEIQIFAEPMFVLYTRDSRHPEKYQLEDGLKILKSRNFDNNKKTLVYIHGFIEGLFADSVKQVVKSYLEQHDHNVLILDWHWYSSPPYLLNAVPNVQKVGYRAGVALLDMINNGLNLARLHVVGHSLGGQMAGVIGRTIQKESRGAVILGRISALDPAFPGFYGIPTVKHLNKYDAEYVDVLHTDVGVYGAPISTGTVDFWPNSGLPFQPGCWNNVCSHQRSWWYWIGSLSNNTENYFYAVKANSWKDFVNGKCDEFREDVTMGNACPAGLYGDYYLQTSDALPFGRGQNGISFVQALIAAVLPPQPLLHGQKSVRV